MPLPLLGLSLHGGLLGGGVAHTVAAGAAATAGVATAGAGTANLVSKADKRAEAEATVIGGSDMLLCTQGLEAYVPLPGEYLTHRKHPSPNTMQLSKTYRPLLDGACPALLAASLLPPIEPLELE